MDNKSLQKQRMLRYFVDATTKIIDSEGIDAVTVKKVSALAGYNSATLYNYFDSLNHLIFFTSLRNLKEYTIDLPKYIANKKNTIEVYLLVWKCFCRHCYSKPLFYRDLFFGEQSHMKVNEAILSYFELFKDEIPESTLEYIPMFVEDNIYARDYILLKKAVAEKYLSADNIREISEMNILLFAGMLDRMIYNHENLSIDEAVKRTMKYMKNTMIVYGVSPQIIDRLRDI